MRHLILAAALLVFAAPLGAQSGDVPKKSVAVPVTIKLFQFAPDTLHVRVGTRIRFTNQDDIAHTATSGTNAIPDGAFKVTLAAQSATGEATLRRPGRYRYYCERHPHMTGEINVTP
jgi:plastocyanin